MTSDQLQELATLLAGQLGAPPWWSYCVIAVATATGVVGASYLKRRGENYATSADFETLKKQLVETTDAAESVKQALASRGWVKQQHWAQREKYYFELLLHVTAMRDACITLFNLESGGSYAEFLDGVSGSALFAQYRAARKGILKILGPASVFLSEPTIESIYKLFEAEVDAREDATEAKQYYNLLGNSVAKTYDLILAEARRELREADQEASAI